MERDYLLYCSSSKPPLLKLTSPLHLTHSESCIQDLQSTFTVPPHQLHQPIALMTEHMILHVKPPDIVPPIFSNRSLCLRHDSHRRPVRTRKLSAKGASLRPTCSSSAEALRMCWAER